MLVMNLDSTCEVCDMVLDLFDYPLIFVGLFHDYVFVLIVCSDTVDQCRLYMF